MEEKKYKLMQERRRIACNMASKALTRRMGAQIEDFAPDEFKASEYHDLRWGWFYYLVHKTRPDLLLKVAYRYESKDFSVTTFTRKWIDLM